MLPTEAFTEVVAFLHLFDLSALAVANALRSSIAVKASTCIRGENFHGLRFCVGHGWIETIRVPDESMAQRVSFPLQSVASLTFAGETDMAEFITAAFPNCVFDDVTIFRFESKHLLDALFQVADSIVIR